MKNGDLGGTIERARLAGRIAIISLILSFILAIVVIVAGPATKWAGMETFTLALYPVSLAFLCAISALFAYFTGVFLVGQSRISEFRYLRPVGSWLICFAIVMFVSAISALFINYGKTGWAAPLTKIFFWILAVFAAELLTAFESFPIEVLRSNGCIQASLFDFFVFCHNCNLKQISSLTICINAPAGRARA